MLAGSVVFRDFHDLFTEFTKRYSSFCSDGLGFENFTKNCLDQGWSSKAEKSRFRPRRFGFDKLRRICFAIFWIGSLFALKFCSGG